MTATPNPPPRRIASGECLFPPGNVAGRLRDLDRAGLRLIILPLRLVALESMSAQLDAKGDVGCALRLDGAPGQVGQESCTPRRRRNSAHCGPAQLHEILGFEVS